MTSRAHPSPADLVAHGMRSTLLGVGVNAVLATVKLVAGLLGNSYALIADAIESTTDIFSSMVVWAGLRVAAKPPDADHPYGHGKAEPLATAAVAGGLFLAALVIAIQSVREILTPHHAPAPWTLVVLALVVIIKETLFRFVLKVGARIDSTAVQTDAWHHRSDALTSLAAFGGILVSWLGGSGYESADDWAALFAAGVIVFNAIQLLRPAIAELTDAAPPPELESDIRAAAQAVAGVQGLDKCHVRKMGFEFYVDLHVQVSAAMSVREGHQIAHRVKDAVRRAVPKLADVLIHIEPASESDAAGS